MDIILIKKRRKNWTWKLRLPFFPSEVWLMRNLRKFAWCAAFPGNQFENIDATLIRSSVTFEEYFPTAANDDNDVVVDDDNDVDKILKLELIIRV